ncbi:MAG: M13 family metallopeptidase [Acidobacteriales bacterium]|nr:M13 family metallopeptidase [Terriglobales bacterium]
MRLRCMLALFCLTTALFAQEKPLGGVELGDLNRSVDPCEDFFEYANGNWRVQNPIPPSMVRWSRRWQGGETNKEQLKSILDDTSAKKDWPKGSAEQLIGDYYASCTDETAVNKRGAEPLAPWLKEIDAIKTPADVAREIRRLHEIAVFAPFGTGGNQNPHDPNMIMADIYASGLSLPDRDYYLKPDARFKEAREKYHEHLIKMFGLLGDDAAKAGAAADVVLAMETKLAEASLDNVALRDPHATDHITSFADLKKMAPHVGWEEYFKTAKFSPAGTINVQEPKFVARVEAMLTGESVADWKTYLRWQLLNATANALSAPFVEESFAFNGKYLGGAREMRPRWKRCAESTDALLGEALGKKYTEKYFPPAAKARMQEMVKNLLAAMGDDIRQLEWMSPETKKKALEKLATFFPKIGYPDKWKDYSAVNVDRNAYFESQLSGRRFAVSDDRSTIGKPVDRGRWGMTPPTSNAYYNPLLNEIVFPAGILQPPGFSMSKVDAVNYGAIGVVIGHEISHGFDDQGAQFDAGGHLENWWSEEDLKKFTARGACVVDQFDNYFIEPGVHHNGKLVLGESIGDLGGARIAYMAWKLALKGRPAPQDIDGFTPEQQFFIAWGQFRGDAIRIETQRLMVQGDPHPTGKYRVNGPLSNLPEFQKAFGCKEGQAMVRPKEKRCDIW